MSTSNAKSASRFDCSNEPFKIVEFAKADPPSGQPDSEWYRYVISQGRAAMAGMRQGSRESVIAAVEDIVNRMNERRLGRSGRVHLKMGGNSKPAGESEAERKAR
ncbi:MAG: hypothetical protein WD448_01335 [Woeseia sp.]